MTFHRLVIPTYSGGLRVGDDYINNAASGTPAPADTALAAGAYSGSYFFAEGDQVTGSAINRGLKALANNTDLLDDRLTAVEASATSAATTAYVDSGDAATLSSAHSYSDSHDATTLSTAEAYADSQDTAHSVPLTSKGAINGVASLDGSGKVPKAQLALTLISLQQISLQTANGGNFSTASFTYVDVTGFQISVASCLAGDILDIGAILQAQTDSSVNIGNMRVVAVDPSATMVGPEGIATINTIGGIVQKVGGLWTVVTPGTVVVKVQLVGNGTGSPTSTMVSTSVLLVRHYRP